MGTLRKLAPIESLLVFSIDTLCNSTYLMLLFHLNWVRNCNCFIYLNLEIQCILHVQYLTDLHARVMFAPYINFYINWDLLRNKSWIPIFRHVCVKFYHCLWIVCYLFKEDPKEDWYHLLGYPRYTYLIC